MRSDPVGMIRGLGEVVTCVYGPAVTYAFPDQATGVHTDGGRRSRIVHASKISGILSGGGGSQEVGKTDGDERDTITAENKGIEPRRSGMQTGVGRDPGARARVT